MLIQSTVEIEALEGVHVCVCVFVSDSLCDLDPSELISTLARWSLCSSRLLSNTLFMSFLTLTNSCSKLERERSIAGI